MKKSTFAFLGDQFSAVPPVATTDLTGKTVIVVGANTGLGFEAAKHFARMNPGKLILACRSEQKGKAALASLTEETGYDKAELWLLDLLKFSSVIAFVDRFEKEGGGRLDILLANAAVATDKYNVSSDGWEESLQVNNLSTPLLCLLLAPKLVETANKFFGSRPRIVVVASEMHYWSELEDEVFNAPSSFQILSSEDYCVKQGKMGSRYAITKLLNVFFTRSLADLLKDTPVIVNTVNPGLCQSELTRNANRIQAIAFAVMKWLLARTQEEGGRQLVYAAVGHDHNVDELRGKYVNLHAINEPSDFVVGEQGKKWQDKLWVDLVDELSKVDGRVVDVVSKFSN